MTCTIIIQHIQTSTIVAAAKRMYGSTAAYSSMALELNASDSRGIDVVRNEIKEFAGTRQLFNKVSSKLEMHHTHLIFVLGYECDIVCL